MSATCARWLHRLCINLPCDCSCHRDMGRSADTDRDRKE